MSASVPPIRTLLQATSDYLEHELLPTLDGYHRFQTRIGLNVLQIAQRELALASAHESAQGARMSALLGHACQHAALNTELARAITRGEFALDDAALVEHLRQSLRESLAINNPKWIARNATDT